MEIRVRSCMYVCMWVGKWVWYLELSREPRHVAQTNEVPKCRSRERALLRHHIIGVRLLTSARRAKLPKQVALKARMAREYWRQPTLSSEDGQLAKTANGIAPD